LPFSHCSARFFLILRKKEAFAKSNKPKSIKIDAMPSAYWKTFGDLNHFLMYLAGNHCHGVNAIALRKGFWVT
jgi:hypothetical protein